MKSRLALILVLAIGLAVSGAHAAFAVTGPSGSNDAAVAQYGFGDGFEGLDLEGLEVGGFGELEAAAQVEAGAGEGQAEGEGEGDLPDTGYAVIPLLIIGAALLATGTLLYRRGRSGGS